MAAAVEALALGSSAPEEQAAAAKIKTKAGAK
jgi:hypothetical protein